MLVDTSAWVEFLRGTESAEHRRLRTLLRNETPLYTTDVIVMEILAGARDTAHCAQLRRLLLRCEFVPVAGLDDHEHAAQIYRECRSAGTTIRALNDCLIAAVALRLDLVVLHRDRDYAAIARHTALRIT